MRSRYAAMLLGLVTGLTSVVVAGCSGDAPESEPTSTASTSAGARAMDPTDGATSDGLPEGFPVDEVPLVDGEIGEVLDNEKLDAYLVKVYPDTDFAAAFEQATARLEAAGFTMGKDVISAGPSSSTADFTSDDWFVVVTGGLPDRVMVQYSVYPAE